MSERSDLLPELGPELGSLADLTRDPGDPELGLEAIRLELVGRLFERAADARKAIAAGNPAGARVALDRSVWLESWQTAVSAAADRVHAVIVARLGRAQARSGFPARRLRELLPTVDDRAVLRAKLDAAGISLEEAVARRSLGDPWWDDVRRSAGALEEAWERLENVVRLELAGYDDRAETIARWRPSLVGPSILAVLLTGVVAWLGLALGGYVPRPHWLDGLHQWFWSLPWP